MPSKFDQATLMAQNARYYSAGELADPETADDELLNAWAVCEVFPDIGYSNFHRHLKKQLRRFPQHFTLSGETGDGRPEDTFLKSEIRRLRTKPSIVEVKGRYVLQDEIKLPSGTVLPRGAVVLSFIRACVELGATPRVPMARETLNDLVDDGLIAFEWWTSPSTKVQERICTEEAVTKLKTTLIERRKATERDGPDGPQILVGHVLKILQPLWRKHGRGKLGVIRFAGWAERGCKQLGWEKIKLYDGRKWILKTDFEKLTKALALPRGHCLIDGEVYVGSSAARKKGINQYKFDRLPKAKLLRGAPNKEIYRVVPLAIIEKPPPYPALFSGIYEDGRVNLKKAEALSGLSRNFLKKCIKKTAYVEEGKLRSKRQTPEGNRRYRPQEEYTVLPADVTELKEAYIRNGASPATIEKLREHDRRQLESDASNDTALASPIAETEARTKRHYPDLGIDVDFLKRTIRNGDDEETFAGELEWHWVSVALAAHPDPYTLDQLSQGYMGEFNKSARGVFKFKLNKKLKALRITLDNEYHISNTR